MTTIVSDLASSPASSHLQSDRSVFDDGSRSSDDDGRAGSLALQIAWAAIAPAPQVARRASLCAVVRLLREALNADMVLCYAARDGASPRRLVTEPAGSPMTRSRLKAARAAAGEVLHGERAGRRVGRDGDASVSHQAGNAVLALPLAASGHHVALVVVWSAGCDIKPEHTGLLERILPILALALPPLLGSRARGAASPPRASRRSSEQADGPAAARGVEARTPAMPMSPTREAAHDSAHAEFMAMVSHELRTPLNTLGGFLEIVLDERVGTLTERQREFLGYASSSAAQLARIIEEMLTPRP